MAIKIRELVIRTIVDETSSEDSPTEDQQTQSDALIAECVEQVFEKLQEMKER
jgi:hypothetical protein